MALFMYRVEHQTVYCRLWSFMAEYRFDWTSIVFSCDCTSKFIWSCFLIQVFRYLKAANYCLTPSTSLFNINFFLSRKPCWITFIINLTLHDAIFIYFNLSCFIMKLWLTLENYIINDLIDMVCKKNMVRAFDLLKCFVV